jgi:hypothetical protein
MLNSCDWSYYFSATTAGQSGAQEQSGANAQQGAFPHSYFTIHSLQFFHGSKKKKKKSVNTMTMCLLDTERLLPRDMLLSHA